MIAIGGGKGGIGKSLLAAGLAVALARRGERCALIDCDLGGANLHTLLGMSFPRASLSDFILRKVERLDEILLPTGVAGLALIAGARNAIEVANPLHQQKLRLLRAIRRLAASVAILDLGAGTHFNIVDFFLLASRGVLVVVPEPTSVENAYRFLKAAFLRSLRDLDGANGLDEALREAIRAGGRSALTAAELVDAVAVRDPAAGAAVRSHLASFRPALVVNQVQEKEDLRLGEGIVEASERLFGVRLGYLGHVHYHDELRRAIRSRRLHLGEQGLCDGFEAELALIAHRVMAQPTAPQELS